MTTLQQEHVKLLREIEKIERECYVSLMRNPDAWVIREEARENVSKYVYDGVRKHLRGTNLRYQWVCGRLSTVMLLMRANVGSRMGEVNVQSNHHTQS